MYVSTSSYTKFTNLKSITLPDGLNSFSAGNDTTYMPALEKYIMPVSNDYYFVENGCLYNADESGVLIPKKLSDAVRVPSNCNDFVLYEYPNVTSLNVHANVTYLNVGYCPSLSNITVDEANEYYKTNSAGNMLLNKNGTSVEYVSANSGLTELVFEEGITSVSFMENSYPNIKSITLPSTLELLWSGSFPDLEMYIMETPNDSYKVCNGILYVGGYIYSYSIPDKMKTVDLSGSGVTYVDISDKPYVEKIITAETLESLRVYNCPSLTELNISASVSSISISGSENIVTINLDSENTNFSKDSYGILYDKSGEIVYLPKTVTSYHITADETITEGKFMLWKNLTSLTMDERDDYVLEDNVLYYTAYGFKVAVDVAGGLTELKLAADATSLRKDVYGYCIFREMPNLQTITVADGNTEMYVMDNILLEKEYLSDSYNGEGYYWVTVLAPKTISGELSLISETQANELFEDFNCYGFKIGGKTFANNNQITSVKISDYVGDIGYGAFMDCPNITKLTFDEYYYGEIGAMSFYYCEKLADITFPNNTILADASALSYTEWRNNQKDDIQYAGTALYYVRNNVTDLNIKEGTVCVAGQSLGSASNKVKTMTLPSSLMYYYEDESMSKVETLTFNHTGYMHIYYRGGSPFCGFYALQKVIVKASNPQWFEEDDEYDIFPSDLSNVQLIVPDPYTEKYEEYDKETGELIGSYEYEVNPLENYQEAYEWRRFFTEGGGIVTGVETVGENIVEQANIFVNGNEAKISTTGNWSIYSMTGQIVKNGRGDVVVSLNSGMYIIKAGDKVKKIVIK